MRNAVGYIPILTTILSALFSASIWRRFRERPRALHLAWWAAGVAIYGVGTLAESWVTLFGWSPPVFRTWYIAGALLGGAPLAQGSVYFHLDRRVAHRLTLALVAYVAVASYFVCSVPLDPARVEPHRLAGKVMEWGWVRLFSPFVNLYAVIFLVGSAALSAWRFRKQQGSYDRFVGNSLIALGAILPGIGGSFTRLGYTEVLYVLEFIGIILIWRGYRSCTREPRAIGRGARS